MAGASLEGLVNPQTLVWARKASRFDVSTAAERVGVSADRLEEWEQGSLTPTLTQLRKLAALYRRSFGMFLLREVPKKRPFRPVDYRRFELSADDNMSPELAHSIREAIAKRDAAIDLFLEMEEAPPSFGLSLSHDASADDAATQLCESVKLPVAVRSHWASDYDALAAWKKAAESLGVLVMQISRVSTAEMRGCALAIFPLPIILLNSSDSPLGRVFTLIHELVHLARAESSLCDFSEQSMRSNRLQAIEVYCNHVAGAVLVPAEDLLSLPLVANATSETVWSGDELKDFRRRYWASREVVLRRLLILDRTSNNAYSKFRTAMKEEYAAKPDRTAGPVPVPRKVVLNNGRFLTALTLHAYEAAVITGTELSRILGTKLDHLPGISQIINRRQAA